MFVPSPIVASPTYDRCGTFAPAPISAFLVSTNVPTFAFGASFDPGRRYAYGPTCAAGPISALSTWARTTDAFSPTTLSSTVVSGPTSAPTPTVVAPRRWVFGSITASRPTVTVTSIQVVAGS